MKATIISSLVCLASLARSESPSLKDPNILVLGDSQVLFRGGQAYLDHFSALAETCGRLMPARAEAFERHFSGTVGVAGIRGASIRSWLEKDGPDKDLLCIPEKSWPQNTRGFGVLKDPTDKFVQVGNHPSFPLCKPGQSAVETMFKDIGVKPRLLVMAILGKQGEVWHKDPEKARDDAAHLAAQVPPGTPCIYMTTAPNFKPRHNEVRRSGQDHFLAAAGEAPGACVPVAGLTDETISVLQGNKQFYKTGKDGKVRDGFHPNDLGIRAFLNSTVPAQCSALLTLIDRKSAVAELGMTEPDGLVQRPSP